MKTPTKRTAHRLAASLAIITALATGGAWADLYWVAQDGTGTWGGNNWSSSASGTGGAWTSGTTALFAQSPNNIDLNGESPSIYTLRPAGSGYSASNRRVVNIYNTSETDSTFTYKITGHGNTDFKNLVVTFGGERSTGKVNVYNSKNNNSTTGTHSLKLAWDSHVVFAANSEYTEAGTTDDMIGNNNAASNSLTVAGGKVTINGKLRLGYYGSGSTGVVQIDDGEMYVTGGDIIVGETANNTGAVVLNGGKLTAKCLKGGAGTHRFVFDGGKLVAGAVSSDGLIASSLPVTVNAGGGTIDNGGFDVSIGTTIGGSGTMTFTGTGTTTLSGAESNQIHVNGGRGFAVDNGGLYSPWEVRVGNGTAGALTVNGGTLEVANNKILRVYANGVINLNGGTLKMPYTAIQNGAVFNFNGGTLQANKSSADFIVASAKINVKDGTINSGNFAITIKSPLGVSGDAGGLTFTGGNTITLNGSVNYSGATAVTPGTVLAIANSTAKANILNNGLVVAGLPTADQTIVTYTSAFEDADLAKVSCPLAPTTTFKFTDETKTAIAVDTPGPALDNCWTGTANDGDLSNAANWSGDVPTTGNANIFSTAPVTLTKGATFAPTSITFLEGSAAVTIDGDTDFENITEIVSRSSASHTINVPVRFTGDIQVKQASMAETSDLTKPHVTFAGGAYAAAGCSLESGNTAAVYSRCIFGKYYLASTSASRWTAQNQGGSKRVCMAPESYLFVPYAGNVSELYVGSGAKVDIGDMNTSGRPAYQVYGEMVVTNLTETGTGNRNLTYGQGTSTPGVFKLESVTNSMSDNWWLLADQNKASKIELHIGAGGMNFGNNNAVYVVGTRNDDYTTIRPWHSDFDVAEGGKSGGGLIMYGDVEFCTDDDGDTGRTITIGAVTRVYSGYTAKVSVSGSGTLKVTKAANNDSSATLTVALKDTATLEYTTKTATLGTGAITLGGGTTFAFQNSGNALALPSPIVLPTDGAATLRIGGDRLRSGKHTIATGVAEGAADHLTVDPASAALGGREPTLAVEDGNLVLNIQPDGLMLIFR